MIHSSPVARQPRFAPHSANRSAILFGAGLASCVIAASLGGAAESVVRLGKLPLLFVDDSGVAARTGVVPTVHPARTHSAPVLQPDQAWEGDRVYIYGSAYRDEKTGQFHLWYCSRPGLEVAGRSASTGAAPSLRNQGFDLTLHATSSDGRTWHKPSLNRIEYKGSSRNNIVFDFHSATVLRDDREPDAAKRYKMLGYLVRPDHDYHAAYSADGIVWLNYPKSTVLEHGDTITLTQHPVTGEYLAYHKRPAEVRGFGRRVVWLSRSRDFQQWSEPELALVPDEADDSWVAGPRERTEIYNMSVYPHATGFVGLPAMFRVMRETPRDKTGPGQSPVDGPIDIQLATSADGRTWKRRLPRVSIIPRGAPGAFDAGTILGVSSTAVHTATETWVYYTAINTGHGGPMPPKRITIGRADWRLHGFVSLDAGPDGGRVETVPLRLAGGRLVVNANAGRGELRVALMEADGSPIDGFGLADCEPLRSDETGFVARWRGRDSVPQDRSIRVALELRNARLFSLSAP
jgi:hypothetical protein